MRRRLVQMLVDALGERAADPLHFRDIVHRRGLNAAQSAKVLDQRLAPLRADAGNLVEHRGGARLAAARPMPDDGKAVRLVADRLDEVQARMRGRKLQGARPGLQDQLLHAGLALRPFRDAYDAGLVQAKLDERSARRAHLSSSAVDQDEVRNPARLRRNALVAARQDLAHGSVVVPWRDVADVEAAVFRLLHLLAIVYDA